MLRVARASAGAAKCKAHFRVGDACARDEPSGSFDAVRSERTVQRIADPPAAVEEMARAAGLTPLREDHPCGGMAQQVQDELDHACRRRDRLS